MKKYRIRDTGAASALGMARLPEVPEQDPSLLWREWLWSETPAAGQPLEDMRQFCEDHKM